MIMKDNFDEKSRLTDPWIYKWVAIIIKYAPSYNLRIMLLLRDLYLDWLTTVTIVELIYYLILGQMTLFDCWNWVFAL